MKTKAPTLREFLEDFPTEEVCLDHLMRTRFGMQHDCAKCGRFAKFHRVSKRRSYACEYCGGQVYPCAGTPFENTRTPLRDWFFVMFQFCTTRNGVSAKKIERDLGVTYKTAWRMCHMIREYMGTVDGSAMIGGDGEIVEVDETFVGGVHKRGTRGGDPAEGKTIVFGMHERGGDIVTQVVPNRKQGTVFPIIKGAVQAKTEIHTDEYRTYLAVGRMEGMSYTHKSVNHAIKQYATPEGVSVNAIEGFWAGLKRGINGTHIHVSAKHLPKYLAEFEYRWNMRQTPHLMIDRLMHSFAR